MACAAVFNKVDIELRCSEFDMAVICRDVVVCSVVFNEFDIVL